MQEHFYESGSCVQKNCASLGVHPNRLGPISGLNRHQRHQNDPLHLPALLWCLRVVVQSQSKENPLQLEIDADITEETARHENRFRIRDDTPGICRARTATLDGNQTGVSTIENNDSSRAKT